jgi:electron transport complex protein RnfB
MFSSTHTIINLLYALSVMSALSLLLDRVVTGLHQKLNQDPNHTSKNTLLAQINRCLPQTQCAQCGYPGCEPYAKAILNQEAGIHLCPPGGDETLQQLAELLNISVIPLDPQIAPSTAQKQIAWIREPECIGCIKCLQVCPVDAIVGTENYLHTVIQQDCTGCGLCLPVCPVDCIEWI